MKHRVKVVAHVGPLGDGATMLLVVGESRDHVSVIHAEVFVPRRRAPLRERPRPRAP